MMRLAEVLVARALAPNIKKAEAFILSGQVLVNDVPVTKTGALVPETAIIRIRGLKKFVSRAGYKLDSALESFDFLVAGKAFLDIGSSTGGFTDALLQRGAKSVAAIDVGRGLLHQSLRIDPRVQVLEATDLGALSVDTLREVPDAFVADVSFTSLEAIVLQAFSLLKPQTGLCEALVLFKPQFELPKRERQLLDKGVLRDGDRAAELLAEFSRKMKRQNIRVVRSAPAALRGTKGNQEYVLHLTLDKNFTE